MLTCANCRKEFADDEFECPHCGTAVIPQMSKADLRLANRKASSGPHGTILAGTGIGLLIGIAVFVWAAFNGKAGFGYAVTGLLMGMAGATVGLLWFQWKRAREERRERSQQDGQ